MRTIAVLVTLLVFAGAAAAQTWNAQYYDNPILEGSPEDEDTFTGPLGLDWGVGSPDDDIDNDNFSARFGTNAFFPQTGVYRFDVLADDGVILRVDGQILIDTYVDGGAGRNYTAEAEITAGHHNVQVDYRESEGVAYVYANWALASGPVDPDLPLILASGREINLGRWLAEFYPNSNLIGNPVYRVEVPLPAADWAFDRPIEEVPVDAFSIRFSTTQYLDAGTYRLTVKADDGVRVFVDGRAVIDQWRGALGVPIEATFSVAEGDHSIVVEYFEEGGRAFLDYNLIWLQTTVEDPFIGTQVEPQPVTAPVVAEDPSLAPPGQPLPGNPLPQEATAGSIASSETGITATITAPVVNVRSEPRIVRGNIISVVSQGQTYPVIGRASNGWFLLQVNDVQGWINGRYANAPNVVTLPVTNP